jgi:5-oxopent-3-ene-1,2,5-tricarboxylate decarboxylase/2-hydroxyhepta-2,4-diene-1,7-dioate isomerase
VRRPEKIVCVGQNYRSHLTEMKGTVIDEPTIFGKFTATVIGDGDTIVLPPESSHVDAEAELAVVIGKAARRVSREKALDYVEGYVCANDVSARDVQYAGGGQWFRGKNFETFCPLGDSLASVKELGDGSGLRVAQKLNGAVLQDGNTGDLMFDVPYLVAYASRLFTLEPGDVILTGTPANSRPMKPGDVVEVEISGIGRLTNTIQEWDVDLAGPGEQMQVSAQTLHVALAIPEDEAERMVAEGREP